MDPTALNKDPDQVVFTNNKTIYDVGYWEIFWRNTIAGLGRGLGNFFFSLIIIVIVMNLFFFYIWPMLRPIASSFGNLTNMVEDLQTLYGGKPLGRGGN